MKESHKIQNQNGCMNGMLLKKLKNLMQFKCHHPFMHMSILNINLHIGGTSREQESLVTRLKSRIL
jgi:hypothetical protein